MAHIFRFALLLIAALAGLSLFLYFFQNSFIFFPHKLSPDYVFPSENFGCKLEEVFFENSHGNLLHGIYASNKNKTNDYVILFSHGNAGNLIHRFDRIAIFATLGVDIFIYDYSGFGKSEGRPTVPVAISDGLAAFEYLTQKRGIEPEKVILYGESLGSGISAIISDKKEHVVAGIVLEAGFRSLRHQASRSFPIIGPISLSTNMPTDEIIKKYTGPLLIIHSENDEMIDFADAVYLHEISPSENKSLLAISSSGHNDPIWHLDNYRESWVDFLNLIKSFSEK